MDPRLLSYYNEELQFVRETGAEFAAEYPKIASRLGIDVFECADPYTERLFEGFALLAARIQLKLDAEFPKFTQHLLDMVCPHYLAPQPAMTIVEFQPDLKEGALADGFTLPRETVLRSQLGRGEQTPCIFRTAHELTLWPLQLAQADYFSRDVAAIHLPDFHDVKAALVLKLETTAGLKFNQISLDKLPLFIRGASDVPMRIYEQLMGNTVGVVTRSGKDTAWSPLQTKQMIRPLGFEDHHALLPYGPRSFQGYRLLQEYFSFPSRYMFAELNDLAPIVRDTEHDTLEIAVLFDRNDTQLANRVDDSNFSLFSCPAINLFPKTADRIHLSNRFFENHIVTDRTRPVDYEVYRVESVRGHGTTAEQEREFHPFYALSDSATRNEEHAYFTVRRQPRMLSEKERKFGTRSSYVGCESFLSLVDGNQAPYPHDLRQLSINVLCTNRDLPIEMPVGVGETDFTLEESAPVESVRCLVGPSKPKPSKSFESGETAWQLISHLSLNYLSLTNDKNKGAGALRELLSLYSDSNDVLANKQVDGIRSIESTPITRPVSSNGPLSFGRGLEVKLTLDESAFEGTGAFLLAAVLESFFAKYVSINSFTETVLNTVERGEVMRWPAKTGRRQIM